MDITTAAQDVLQLIAAEGQSLPVDVNQAEKMIRDKVQQIGQAALQLHLAQQKKLGYRESAGFVNAGTIRSLWDIVREPWRRSWGRSAIDGLIIAVGTADEAVVLTTRRRSWEIAKSV